MILLLKKLRVQRLKGQNKIERKKKEKLNGYNKENLYVGIRPNNVKIVDSEVLPKFEIYHVEELGYQRNIFIEIDGATFILQDDSNKTFKVGDFISFEIDNDKISLFDIDTEERI